MFVNNISVTIICLMLQMTPFLCLEPWLRSTMIRVWTTCLPHWWIKSSRLQAWIMKHRIWRPLRSRRRFTSYPQTAAAIWRRLLNPVQLTTSGYNSRAQLQESCISLRVWWSWMRKICHPETLATLALDWQTYTSTWKNNWMAAAEDCFANGQKPWSNTNRRISFIKYGIRRSNNRYFTPLYQTCKYLKFRCRGITTGATFYVGCLPRTCQVHSLTQQAFFHWSARVKIQQECLLVKAVQSGPTSVSTMYPWGNLHTGYPQPLIRWRFTEKIRTSDRIFTVKLEIQVWASPHLMTPKSYTPDLICAKHQHRFPWPSMARHQCCLASLWMQRLISSVSSTLKNMDLRQQYKKRLNRSLRRKICSARCTRGNCLRETTASAWCYSALPAIRCYRLMFIRRLKPMPSAQFAVQYRQIFWKKIRHKTPASFLLNLPYAWWVISKSTSSMRKYGISTRFPSPDTTLQRQVQTRFHSLLSR